jgi:mycothiol synthase
VTMLAAGYSLRHTRPDDVAAAQAVVDAAETAVTGEPRRGEFEVAAGLADTRVDLATNTWVVDEPGGGLAGFASLFWAANAQGEAESHVQPAHAGKGVGDALLDAIERRAQELAASAPNGVVPRLHIWCAESRERRRATLVERSFRAVRESCLMRLDLGDAPPVATPVPDGIVLRRFVPERDERAVYEADEEAFGDHFLHVPATIEQWRTGCIEHPRFDPSLWLVAWDAADVAGECLTFVDEHEAYVDSLAVRRRWRGRGLGLALTTRAFVLAHERGLRKVRLGVDAQNPTGALALYLKAGMRVERRETVYAKDLR